MTQQYPQPPHGQVPMQPPKKKNSSSTKTALIIVGSVVGGLVLIGILGSLGGNDADPDSTAGDQPTTTASATAPAPKPVAPTTAPAVPKTTAKPVPVKPAEPKLTCEDQEDRSKPCTVKGRLSIQARLAHRDGRLEDRGLRFRHDDRR
ncbi:hypothetical protein ACFVWG_18420 [Kribbella sp. NPDC058245]|uniref:hypothetical protein n=1 Tax=Kribbella sp. NPDC058245 TaxID=3346399 RepID=UPI0036E246A0